MKPIKLYGIHRKLVHGNAAIKIEIRVPGFKLDFRICPIQSHEHIGQPLCGSALLIAIDQFKLATFI